MKIDTKKLTDIKVEGIDTRDYPKFCDAFIVEAKLNGIPLTEKELDEVNDDSYFIHKQVLKTLY